MQVLDGNTMMASVISFAVVIDNTPPIADAGDDRIAQANYLITLDASRSSDSRGDDLSYAWQFIESPPESMAELQDETTMFPAFTVDAPGKYVLQLVVNDNIFDSEPDTVAIHADVFGGEAEREGEEPGTPGVILLSPSTLFSENTSKNKSPHTATDSAGIWVAVWKSTEHLPGDFDLDFNILVSRSIDNGATWTDAEFLNTTGSTDSWSDIGPRMVTDGVGNWIATWASNREPFQVGADVDIFAVRSSDSGVTWTTPSTLNVNAPQIEGTTVLQ